MTIKQSKPVEKRHLLSNSSLVAPTSLALAMVIAAGSALPAIAAIDNTATVSGTPPGGSPGDTTNTATESVPVNAVPSLSMTKVGVLTETEGNTTDGLAEAGDTILYTYTVTNNGTVTIADVTVSDEHEGGVGAGGLDLVSTTHMLNETPDAGNVSSTDSTLAPTSAAADGSWDSLAPGESVTFTYSHTVTQAEVDAG